MTLSAASLPYDRVLVTGGAGYIGGQLCTVLSEGADVLVVDRSVTSETAGITYREFDIRETALIDRAVASVECVFHLAAEIDVSKTVADPYNSAQTNVIGTVAVLEAARKYDIPVILASSAAVYGDPRETPLQESVRCTPTSPYGLEKLTCDRYARLYRELYGLDVLSLRYFNVYGPGERTSAGVIRRFIQQAQDGGPITIHGDGTQTRDFVHIHDVIRANILAASAEKDGLPINIGTGSAVTIRDLAERIVSMIDPSVQITHIDRPEGDIQRSCADITRAEDVLGYQPTISLSKGLEQYLSVPA